MADKIYICSPYSGDIEKNVSFAQQCCRYAVLKGYLPVAPHLFFTQFLDDNIPEEREIGIKYGEQLMNECSEVWVMGPRISAGMKNEIEIAGKKKKRIIFIKELN